MCQIVGSIMENTGDFDCQWNDDEAGDDYDENLDVPPVKDEDIIPLSIHQFDIHHLRMMSSVLAIGDFHNSYGRPYDEIAEDQGVLQGFTGHYWEVIGADKGEPLKEETDGDPSTLQPMNIGLVNKFIDETMVFIVSALWRGSYKKKKDKGRVVEELCKMVIKWIGTSYCDIETSRSLLLEPPTGEYDRSKTNDIHEDYTNKLLIKKMINYEENYYDETCSNNHKYSNHPWNFGPDGVLL